MLQRKESDEYIIKMNENKIIKRDLIHKMYILLNFTLPFWS